MSDRQKKKAGHEKQPGQARTKRGEGSPRRAYAPPSLKPLGSVRELTLLGTQTNFN